jgi:ATP-dependent DNA helicase PIF1
MSYDDDDADRDVDDHNDKDDDDDAEEALISGDGPVCKSCGNFGHRGNAPHVLKFAEGDVAFHMRTLDKRKCLTSNTRVQILDVKRRFIRVQTMTDRPTTHLIPRIIFSFAMTQRNPFVINRLQFPLRLAYAMTFNKSQGQTLEKVLIDGTAQHLPGRGSINGAFMHGHCNVALSRVRNRESLAILVDETNLVTDPTTGKKAARTTNIVCRKILDV